MTTPTPPSQPSDIHTFMRVCRELSPAHAAVWRATVYHFDAQSYATTNVAHRLGMTVDSVTALTNHLVQQGYLERSLFPMVTQPDPPIINDEMPEKVQSIYNNLTTMAGPTLWLEAANIPSAVWDTELRRVAFLCADDDVKNPMAYAKAIILHQLKEPIYGNHPDARARTGRTPIEPG